MSMAHNRRLRQLAYGADLVREAAEALRLPHPVACVSQMLLHRFYAGSGSLRDHCVVWVAGACILLAAKDGEVRPCSVRHIANVLHDRLLDREGFSVSGGATDGGSGGGGSGGDAGRESGSGKRVLDFYGAQGFAWKDGVMRAERAVLCALGFRLFADVPHKLILVFVNAMREHARAAAWTGQDDGSPFRALLQTSWNFANDALLGPVCVRETAVDIACACMTLAARKIGMTLPEGWQTVFQSSRVEGDRVAKEIEEVYMVAAQLRGAFVDFSRCEIFARFHPAQREEDDVGSSKKRVPDGVMTVEAASSKRRRMRFADAAD